MIGPATSKALELANRTSTETVQPSGPSTYNPLEDAICPHLEYFTILALDPKLSAKNIGILKRASEVQAMRVTEARRNNGVFRGARIGWHKAFVRSKGHYIISKTKKLGLEWKAFI
jgi:hypothetical protein